MEQADLDRLLAELVADLRREASGPVTALIRERLAGDPALSKLARDINAGIPTQRDEQRVRLSLEDAVSDDPVFGSALAKLLERSEVTTAHGPDRADQRARVEISADHGARVNNRIKNSQHNIRIATGGGLVLALVIAAIWWQYSRSNDVADYRKQAAAVCTRIQASSPSVSPHFLGTADPYFDREEIVAVTRSRSDAIASTLDGFLTIAAPGKLRTDRTAVVSAEAQLKAASSVFATALHRDAPRRIPLLDIASYTNGPAGQSWTRATGSLGDALSRLADAPCDIEVTRTSS